jgi:uracil-DNA glycosylase
MPYDKINCPRCPYFEQRHIGDLAQRTVRTEPPIPLEEHGSTTLLVFQAPGIEEWAAGAAIQPTIKSGGTAGRRIFLSWERARKTRHNFDIVNAVQCYPGTDGARDAKPNVLAVCSCAGRLEHVLTRKTYTKVIAFGVVAGEVLEQLRVQVNGGWELQKSEHPTGGATNEQLDSLW